MTHTQPIPPRSVIRRVLTGTTWSHKIGATLTAVVAVVVALRIHPTALGLAYAAMLLLAIAGALIDVTELRLPDRITYVIAGAGIVVYVVAQFSGEFSGLGRAVAGGALYGGLALMMGLVDARAFALGDIKLCAGLGIWLAGWTWGTLVAGCMSALALICIRGMLIKARSGASREFPAGPALVAGAILGLLATTAV